jgi:elongator complex protein 1
MAAIVHLGRPTRPDFRKSLDNGISGCRYLLSQLTFALQEVWLTGTLLEELCSRKRWSEGARVYLDYASDVPEAVRALSNGNDLDEALRIVSPKKTKLSSISNLIWISQCTKNGRSDLINDVVHSVALDLIAQMFDDLQEMEDQMKKQYARLQELRKNKADNLSRCKCMPLVFASDKKLLKRRVSWD